MTNMTYRQWLAGLCLANLTNKSDSRTAALVAVELADALINKLEEKKKADIYTSCYGCGCEPSTKDRFRNGFRFCELCFYERGYAGNDPAPGFPKPYEPRYPQLCQRCGKEDLLIKKLCIECRS